MITPQQRADRIVASLTAAECRRLIVAMLESAARTANTAKTSAA